MRYLLDTNAVVAVLRNRPTSVRERLSNVLAAGDSVAISSIVLYELWYGVARSGRPRETAEHLTAFLSGDVAVVGFDEGDAATAGRLRASLEAAGQPIGPYDLMIAAQALQSGSTLVTANTAEFARAEGLTTEDWAS